MHWYSAEPGKIPLFTFSDRIWGPFPLFFLCLCVCVSFHAPVLCFLAINSGGLWKQVAESNSQQMPPHKVKISLQAVYETSERNTTRERQLPFMSESHPNLSFLYHLLSNVGEYYKSNAAVHLDCLQFGGCFVLVCLHFSHCWWKWVSCILLEVLNWSRHSTCHIVNQSVCEALEQGIICGVCVCVCVSVVPPLDPNDIQKHSIRPSIQDWKPFHLNRPKVKTEGSLHLRVCVCVCIIYMNMWVMVKKRQKQS